MLVVTTGIRARSRDITFVDGELHPPNHCYEERKRRLEELHIHQEKRLEEIHIEQARNVKLILKQLTE